MPSAGMNSGFLMPMKPNTQRFDFSLKYGRSILVQLARHEAVAILDDMGLNIVTGEDVCSLKSKQTTTQNDPVFSSWQAGSDSLDILNRPIDKNPG